MPSDNPRAVIGNNQPSAPTPFEIAEKAVNDVVEECRLWLDGKVIDNKDLADGVGNLLTEIRKAHALADAALKDETDPHNAALTEIRGRYYPLTGDTKTIKGKTVMAEAACKAALQPWLVAEAKRINAEAAAARAEADRKRREAEDALRASDAQNLAEREAAETLLRDAKKADTAANVAERKTATAGGAFGRAIGVRTTWIPELTDGVALVRHYWASEREAFETLAMQFADRDLRAGKRNIPGVVMVEKKVAA